MKKILHLWFIITPIGDASKLTTFIYLVKLLIRALKLNVCTRRESSKVVGTFQSWNEFLSN